MSVKSIIITGANGFIGNALVKYFAEREYKVFALARSIPLEMPANAEFVRYSLEGNQDIDNAFKNACCLIHCAYVKYNFHQKDSDKINMDGSLKLFELSRKYDLKKIVYFSSFSAHPDSISHYGKSKLAIEKTLNPSKDLILRPGLVIGNGGLYKSIYNIVSKNKFVPILGGGLQTVQTIDIKELSLIIQKGIEDNISGIYAAAEPEAITMKTLYKAIARKTGKKKIYFNFPYWCAELLIFLASITHIKISISKENILGLKNSMSYDISKLIESFGIIPANYNKTIESMQN